MNHKRHRVGGLVMRSSVVTFIWSGRHCWRLSQSGVRRQNAEAI